MENQTLEKSTNDRQVDFRSQDATMDIDTQMQKVRISSVNDRWSYSIKLEQARTRYRNFGKVGAHIFLTTKRIKPSRKELEAVNSSKKRYFELDNRKVAFYQWGSAGKMILLVHGWNGNVGNFSRLIPDLVSKGFFVVGIDLPGHGDSEGRYSNAVLASRAVYELTKIVGNPYGIVTHSFGGAAATIAQDLGVTAERLVYFCPPKNLMSITLGFANYWKLSQEEIQKTIEAIEFKVKRSLSELDLIKIGKTLSNKLLLIHDKDDMEIPYFFGEEVSKAWENSDFLLTSGLGHRMILRDEGIKTKVLDFLMN